ncbi:MAG: RnfABCDGE type electron transport complex subunit G [Candidatus Brocadiales bacterium]|nr:RnfABCDGE type electron transport complex subunit G [Candidatus Bathyanammoxibius amoris]
MGKRLQYTLVLGVIAMVTSVGVGATYVLTKDRIARKEADRRMEALLTVMPGIAGDPVQLTPPETAPEDRVFKGQDKDGNVVGYAALGRSQGYSSTLKVMVGLTPDKDKILGIKVLYQAETPGLGTRIVEIATTKTLWTMIFGGEKAAATEEAVSLTPWFCDQFKGKTLNQLEVVRQEDPAKITAITGATITTRAVVKAVENAIAKVKKAPQP